MVSVGVFSCLGLIADAVLNAANCTASDEIAFCAHAKPSPPLPITFRCDPMRYRCTEDRATGPNSTVNLTSCQAKCNPPAPPPPPPDPHAHDATLSSLKVSSGTLVPPFDIRTIEYKAQAAVGVTSITVVAVPTDHGALLAVNNVAVGPGQPSSSIKLSKSKPTRVAVVVTASDGKSMETFTVMYSMSPGDEQTDASLKSLVPSISRFQPAFSPTGVSYGMTLSKTTPSITLTGTTNAVGATMTSNDGYGPQPMVNGKPSKPLKIDSSKTSGTFFVVVTAPDGKNKKTYTIDITLQADHQDARLHVSGAHTAQQTWYRDVHLVSEAAQNRF